jgi:hypothetical protein
MKGQRTLLVCGALAVVGITAPAPASAESFVQRYELRKCPGAIASRHEPSARYRYARYRALSCARARAIVRKVESPTSDGGYPHGYSWGTPHGAGPYPRIFNGRLHSVYLSPDGAPYKKIDIAGGIAVALYR